MQECYKNIKKSISHIEILHEIFYNKNNFERYNIEDYGVYYSNYECLKTLIDDSEGDFRNQLYGEKGRQMILADIIEYIFIGRGYYFAVGKKDKKYRIGEFINIMLNFVNLLMCYENITVDIKLRKKFLEKLSKSIPELNREPLFKKLLDYDKEIGLPTDEDKTLSRYFDSILPKTAGGLWHELLVYSFMLRFNFGHIIPLLLTQRLLSGYDKPIVPPDFLILTKDKRLYGIEVGVKKEIQSGSFSLETNIPTATLDTINSRSSDRCPICKKWILFCQQVIEDYSNLPKSIINIELKCLNDCRKFKREEILNGICPYMKYSRNKLKTIKSTHHDYANGYHYHYKCILKKVRSDIRDVLMKGDDEKALKTHFPFYQGLESLIDKRQHYEEEGDNESI